MRVVPLSDHPGDMLRAAQQRREADAGRRLQQRRQELKRARRDRDQARAGRRWLSWWRGVLAVRRAKRQVQAAPQAARPDSDEEAILAAGIAGEQQVVTDLGRVLNDEWTLLRGYHNSRGEIDHLLVGPRGVFAIEGKHRNATVHCDGDHWWFVKYDHYGNEVGHGEITDRRGRSPSQQLNQPADLLAALLRSQGHPVRIERIVLLTHQRSQVGRCTNPTVHVLTSPTGVRKLIRRSDARLSAAQRAELEQLIVDGHQQYAAARSPGRRGGPARRRRR
jgi:hypothetical protein